MTRWLMLGLGLALVAPAGAAPVDGEVLASQPAVRRALDRLREAEPTTVDEQIRICEIPAPPFEEQQRAAYLRRRFDELGLREVRIDPAGNVIGVRPGAAGGSRLVLSAHLDTVFPAGTDVRVSRQGRRLRAPGIGDDSRGLAVLLAVARVLDEVGIETEGDLVFVATVGEEGLGNLRGVRYLLEHELRGRVDHFVSIESPGLHVTVGAVGSRRFRVTMRGPGGHSFHDFGVPNPIHALARGIVALSRTPLPDSPRTTFNTGRIGGGTAVNAIPESAWLEVDLRSESAAALAELEAAFRRAMQEGAAQEQEFRPGESPLEVDVASIGDRPAGVVPRDSPIVAAVLAANAALGIEARFDRASTDANLPISLGIPALALGGGGRGRGIHTLAEQFDPTGSHLGTQRALLVALTIVGLAPDGR